MHLGAFRQIAVRALRRRRRPQLALQRRARVVARRELDDELGVRGRARALDLRSRRARARCRWPGSARSSSSSLRYARPQRRVATVAQHDGGRAARWPKLRLPVCDRRRDADGRLGRELDEARGDERHAQVHGRVRRDEAMVRHDRDRRLGIVRERRRGELADHRVDGLERAMRGRHPRPVAMLGAVERDQVHGHEIGPLLAQYCRGEARAHDVGRQVVVVAVDEGPSSASSRSSKPSGRLSARSSFTSSSLTARQNSGIR